MQLLRANGFFELSVSNRPLHADFNDFAKPLKLARACDIFRPARSQLFVTSGLKSRCFQKSCRPNGFLMVFAKIIPISLDKCILRAYDFLNLNIPRQNLRAPEIFLKVHMS